ncbi:hypothetical protein StoSoilB22_18560 [Arthrobacter sp. StoSoilB22]|nr:hypothetical protein StoSoilB22_18560 [Arthrobacter sp. StoSoilB22]
MAAVLILGEHSRGRFLSLPTTSPSRAKGLFERRAPAQSSEFESQMSATGSAGEAGPPRIQPGARSIPFAKKAAQQWAAVSDAAP